MGKIRTVVSNFASGELDPRLFGRIDKQFYYNGASKLRNVLVHPHGGAFRRPGLQFVDDLGVTAINGVKLIEFAFNNVQTYVFAIIDSAALIYRDDELVKTLTLPFLSADIDEITWVQSADVLIIFHPDHHPQKIVRGATHADWTAVNLDFSFIPKFAFTVVTSSPAFTLQPSAISGNIKLTAGGVFFLSTDIGSVITGNGGEATVTSFISTTVVQATVNVEFFDTALIASGAWQIDRGFEDVWSIARGWPRSGTFHAGRLWIGGAKERPNTIWGSHIGDFFNFDPGQGFADQGLDFTLDTDQVNHIRNLISSDHLLIFTSGGEFYQPKKANEGITPSNFEPVRQDKRGSGFIRPIFVDGATIFIQRNADIVREFLFSDLEQKYNANNISLLSSQLIKAPVDMAHSPPNADSDSDLIYVINADGTWAVLNSLRKQEITSWVGGATDTGVMLSVAYNEFFMYCAVKRTIDGVTTIYLERFNFDHMLDSSIVVDNGTPSTVFSGFDHLEGETVEVWGDPADGLGFFEGSFVVTGGDITTINQYSKIEAGYNLNPLPQISLMPIERELPDGVMVGERRRIPAIKLSFDGAHSVTVNNRPVKFRQFGQEIFDQPLPAFVGIKRVTNLGHGRRPPIDIRQTGPGPFELLSVLQEVTI